VTRAALSLVPKSWIARSFNDAANRSMNSVPTALTSDGPDPAMPHTSSPTPRATPAATTPAMAPSAGVTCGPVDGGDGSALSGVRSVATAMAERYARAAHTVLAPRETIAKLASGPLGPPRRRRTVTLVTAPDGPQVLVVDDEPMVREVVATYLQRDGLRVHEAADGSAAEAWLATHRPDLVVLDIMLPGTDGLEILRRLRAKGDTPVILLTARAEEVDRVVGLELGADDYVVKPFGFRELVARIRAVTRRADRDAPPETGLLVHGPIEVDPRTRRVRVHGAEVPLTRKEFDLLLLLARDPGATCTRQHILEEVWDAHWYGPTKTLDVHIAALRKKLGEPDLIETVRGVGFRLAEAGAIGADRR